MKCLPDANPTVPSHPIVDVVILDGAVVVQMLDPRMVRTFDEYFNNLFAPYVLKHLESAKRVDPVWDVYQEDSLKKSLREKRGSGQRRKVLGSTRIPTDWKGFLRVDSNKQKLFQLLATKVGGSMYYLKHQDALVYTVKYFIAHTLLLKGCGTAHSGG